MRYLPLRQAAASIFASSVLVAHCPGRAILTQNVYGFDIAARNRL
jgi:hypothetical protein